MPVKKEMKVLIIGSGPTTIGQAGECHEGGLEACRVLRAMGNTVITVDANPDAIFNTRPWSQRPVVGPLTPGAIAKLIAKEKPDALMTLFSGRNGLRLISQLNQEIHLSELNIALWGPSIACIDSIRDRDTLQLALAPIGLKTPSIYPVDSVDAAIEKAQEIGFPVVLRCNDAQLIPDGLLIYNQDELNRIGAVAAGEPDSKFSIEPSLVEWQQVELEVLRDNAGEAKLAGGIEYIDTASVHPGDAIGVCPLQSLSAEIQSLLFKQAEEIAEHLKIMGNVTIRFAYHPSSHDCQILAVHPRYTMSSALVARISGIPIAQISALLASGKTWRQLPEEITRSVENSTRANVVGIKWPKWDFLRFEGGLDRLGPQMRSTGHTVGYGQSFGEAFQKASRSTGIDQAGLSAEAGKLAHLTLEELMARMVTPTSHRSFEIYAAMCKGASAKEISRLTHISTWFIEQLKGLADIENRIEEHRMQMPEKDLLQQAKYQGFLDSDISRLTHLPIEQVKTGLLQFGIEKKWIALPGGGKTLRFGTFGSSDTLPATAGDPKLLILGNGAYGIGNGAECDIGIFNAAQAAESAGYAPILLNSNLSSPTTGHSSPCTCYCEPMSLEEIADVVRAEQPTAVMTQFSGAHANAFATALSSIASNLLVTPWSSQQQQPNRISFRERIRNLGIPQPGFETAQTREEAAELASRLGFPMLVSNPKGRLSEIIQDPSALEGYMADIGDDDLFPLSMEQLLEYAIEAQAEVLCDGSDAITIAILEHIELAGVHAGDSAAVLPPYSISPRHIETIKAYCHKIATTLGIKGLMNIRFGIYRDTVYFLDARSDISRNLATVSIALEAPVVEWATRLILGESMEKLGIGDLNPAKCSVRAPVFPFNVFPEVDPLLGPNMRSLGQVVAHSDNFGLSYFKALEATATPLPIKGTVLVTVTDEDKPSIVEPTRIFSELGFNIMATRGTHEALAEHGIQSAKVRKLGFGRPNLIDEIKNGNVQIVINTPTGGQGQIDDSEIRKAAIGCRIVNITTPASALAAAKGIAAAIRQNG